MGSLSPETVAQLEVALAGADAPKHPIVVLSKREVIVRYSQDFGRMGGLNDTFVCTDLELRAFKAVGRCHRGEVLGKHSDVTSRLDDDTLTVLTDDAAFIAQAKAHGLVFHWNPFSERLGEQAYNEGGAEMFPGLTPDERAELGRLWGFSDTPAEDA